MGRSSGGGGGGGSGGSRSSWPMPRPTTSRGSGGGGGGGGSVGDRVSPMLRPRQGQGFSSHSVTPSPTFPAQQGVSGVMTPLWKELGVLVVLNAVHCR